jgi:hypothetical protein
MPSGSREQVDHELRGASRGAKLATLSAPAATASQRAHDGSAAAARMTGPYGIRDSPSIGAPATHRGTPQRVEELSGALQPPAQASVHFS